MKPFDPSLEELYVRWAQFASVSPLMRLHGHRNGGPPEDPVCMQTNGDNEPWTLFSNQTNYDAFVAAIVWREQMRNYVMDAQAEWAASNAPMIAPVWLLFPGDPVCALQKDVSEGACFGAFMCACLWGGGGGWRWGGGRAARRGCPPPTCCTVWLSAAHLHPPSPPPAVGKDWLAKPITRLGQTSEWAYLPGLPAGQTWVGLHTGVNYGQGPVNVTVPTTPVSNWPLFYRNSA
jgi:alpha-glucosidase (family GH31 glycosyl hydrolase)